MSVCSRQHCYTIALVIVLVVGVALSSNDEKETERRREVCRRESTCTQCVQNEWHIRRFNLDRAAKRRLPVLLTDARCWWNGESNSCEYESVDCFNRTDEWLDVVNECTSFLHSSGRCDRFADAGWCGRDAKGCAEKSCLCAPAYTCNVTSSVCPYDLPSETEKECIHKTTVYWWIMVIVLVLGLLLSLYAFVACLPYVGSYGPLLPTLIFGGLAMILKGILSDTNNNDWAQYCFGSPDGAVLPIH